MPRLLSSYAANKRVEAGLSMKQEVIRKEYKRATHRYLDETDKLVDELIQIHVKTPSAFTPTPTNSAKSNQGRTPHSFSNAPQGNNVNPNQKCVVYPHLSSHGPKNNPSYAAILGPQVLEDPTATFGSLSSQLDSLHSQQLELARERRMHQGDGTATTEDSNVAFKRDIPPPVIELRGDDIFYRYSGKNKNAWKKMEQDKMAYRTKMILHRNKAVLKALKEYDVQRRALASDDCRATNTQIDSEKKRPSLSRKDSLHQRRGSEFNRLAARRGSRRASQLGDDDVSIPPIVELRPQLSPGHTPRMLDGWTLMNLQLWKKTNQKPVWASKRYIERKEREFKQYQASKSAAVKEHPSVQKPASADAASREARRKKTEMLKTQAEDAKMPRAKSVPARRISSQVIVEVDNEEDDDAISTSPVVAVEKPILRPVTSILRVTSEKQDVDANRPKTTNHKRRVAIDTFSTEHAFRDGPRTDRSRVSSRGTSVDINDLETLDSYRSNDTEDEGLMCSNDEPFSLTEMAKDVLVLRPKKSRRGSAGKRLKATFMTEEPEEESHTNRDSQSSFSAFTRGVEDHPQNSLSVDKAGLSDRMPSLVATKLSIPTNGHETASNLMSTTPMFPQVVS